MKLLVTGATGYAGRHIATALHRHGHIVLGLTRSPQSPAAHRLAAAGVRPVGGELAAPDTYRDHLRDVDTVIHLAMDYADPVAGDRTLFAEMTAAERPAALVYTTGISLHGRIGDAVLDETSPSNPQSPLHFRFQLERELATTGLRHTIVRPSFLYGHEATTSQLGNWFARAAGGAATFYGDRDKRWSWVHVDDLADAYVKIVKRTGGPDADIFVLGEEDPPTALTVFTAAARAAGFTGAVTVAPIPAENWLEQAADQDEIVTSAKARKELDWQPRHTSPLPGIEAHHAAWKAAADA